MDALESEGLLELVEARQDAPPPDPLSACDGRLEASPG